MFKNFLLIAVCLCAGNFLFAQKEPDMTSRNVCVLDTAFFMPQLNRHRRVWIYLPENYCNNKQKYPVLYMNDGQNIFSTATSYAGEWGVDEALDSLSKHLQPCIVVAIDNGSEKRMSEYAPYDFKLSSGQLIKAEGKAYTDFVANTLKPFIDKQYRSKKTAAHTFIGGSSFGALISLYTLLQYPKKFGGAAIFSPSFWAAPQLKDDIMKTGSQLKAKVYFYAGKQESEDMIPNMLSMLEVMNKFSKAKITTVIRDGKHNEAAWKKEFPLFYKWLMPASVNSGK
jgi:predicted alpha/beta superfamily hydrolase